MAETKRSLPVEVYTERTFSSQTLKFVTNMMLLNEVGADFSSKKQATPSPLAQRLFEFDEVQNVFIYRNFVSVTKSEDADWFRLKAQLRQAIKKHLQSDQSIVEEDYKLKALRQLNPQADDPVPVKKVKEVLAKEVHPSIGVDGGAVVFNSYKDGVVYIEFEGAYCNCPSSKATVRSSVETLLTEKVAEVKSVCLYEPELL